MRPQYLDAMLNDPYMNVLQVKYGYALTCHKAQGGEWDTAIVDLEGKFFYKNEVLATECRLMASRHLTTLLNLVVKN